MQQTSTVPVDGATLRAQAFGSPADPAVLLVMGAMASMIRWEDDFCERLASAGRFVIRYDSRDVGHSTSYRVGEATYLLADLVRDAVAVLDAFGVGAAHVVGASMGGMIAQLFALEFPERVLSITPIMTTPDPSGPLAAYEGKETAVEALPTATPEILGLLGSFATTDWSDEGDFVSRRSALSRGMAGSKYAFDDETERKLATREYREASSIASCQNHAMAMISSPLWRERLPEIECPVLVIHGAEDPVLPHAHGVALSKEIPGATLHTMEGVGHEIPRGEWRALVQVLLEHTGAAG